MNDVIIIGGGPAGSTVAALLGKMGYQVTLFEKECFPREHVGESLLPFCYHIFEELGVLEQMKSHPKFTRKATVRFVSKDGQHATNWCFNHVIKDESFLSFHVVRRDFDLLMLDNARANNVAVYEGTKVEDIAFKADHVEVSVSRAAESQTHQARFLIDASGRGTFLASKNGWREPNRGLERTALWTHWDNVPELSGELQTGASVILYLGGEKRGWIWVFPLGLHEVTVGVVLDSFYLRDQRKALENEHGKNWMSALYQRELEESSFVYDLLKESTQKMDLHVEGDYSYTTKQKYGNRFAMIGDASRFIDPIFSSGVFLSMKSGQLLAHALDTMFKQENFEDLSALTRIYEQINGAYDLVHRLIKLYYQPHSLSWAEAGSFFSPKHKEHEDAMAAGHYILAGDFFENHQKHHQFLDVIENAQLFEHYREFVINREDFQEEGSCGMTPKDIFPELASS